MEILAAFGVLFIMTVVIGLMCCIGLAIHDVVGGWRPMRTVPLNGKTVIILTEDGDCTLAWWNESRKEWIHGLDGKIDGEFRPKSWASIPPRA